VPKRPIITRIETFEIPFEVPNRWRVAYAPGKVDRPVWSATRIETDVGIVGGHFTWAPLECAGVAKIGPSILGREALQRETIYNLIKRNMRTAARLGMASIDNCLWDIAGKYYDEPIYRLLGGGHRTRVPIYASTLCGDDQPDGLSSPEAYADFAEQCYEMGYRGFKMHTWWQPGPIQREVELIHAVGRRVGSKMDLMIDVACRYETFADALTVGRACDEEGYFWYEDPFMDGGVAHMAHQRLRELLDTPLLQGEHERGLECKANLLTAHATDLLRGDAEIDGITATFKLAAAAEALGVDIELHGCLAESRHIVAAIRNTNYLEWSLVHPHVIGEVFPFCRDGFANGVLDAVGADGCIEVPQGPGLGVDIDWDYVRSHALNTVTID